MVFDCGFSLIIETFLQECCKSGQEDDIISVAKYLYEKGHREGVMQGIQSGTESGLANGQATLLLNMLSRKVSREDISKLTGLSLERISELLKE